MKKNLLVISISIFFLYTLYFFYHYNNDSNDKFILADKHINISSDSEVLSFNYKENKKNIINDDEKVSKNNQWMIPSEEYLDYLDIKEKALLTDSDKDAFIDLLNSNIKFDFSKNQIFEGIYEEKYTKKNERNRILAVSYISSVLNSNFKSINKNNAIQLVIDLLEREEVYDIQDLKLKKSLIGDKIELGMAFAIFHPELWKKYKENHRSIRSRRINIKIEENVKVFGKKLKQEISKI
tara:strand:- start:2795 stop:3508 length:714 start_codon:yes stop_codon:yes gene_type:complete